ncbi:TIM barrel protein [Nocardioides sp. MAH-18]|uniref:TIM barrel protein n=1 Tax=Nocardioides agri TaxID=2682843 RepID=A0A6L6XVM3_9ACTN|nr:MULTISPECIES: sugar phosphate isomerase/epimerase [unclassified Nocardioides]MBA2955878.1 sugar phosphate isomerase/epimerase [Nocardioides sp. CGMCC 1.13656]MVQ50727.1 TIM barrel protein [Nocardioides sp. MAH-18]
MCFGFDGERALRDSLDQKGASRRSVFRGAAAIGAAGAVGAAALGAASPAVAHGHRGKGGRGHGSRVPHELISIQMYTLRDVTDGTTLPTILERLAQYGYERVELAGYYKLTAAQMKAALDAQGIRATSSHDGLSNRNSAAIRTKMENAKTLGQKYVVVPYLVSDQLSYWQDAADQMNAEAAIARRYGLRYGYHNHAHEFTTDLGGGVTPWEVLTERLDPRLVHLEVDLYWAYTGGVNSGAADPLEFAIDVVRSAPQEVRQYHVKDRAASNGDMADLGTGVIDFAEIFRKHRVEEYIVENDTPDVTPLTTAAVGHGYLEHLKF